MKKFCYISVFFLIITSIGRIGYCESPTPKNVVEEKMYSFTPLENDERFFYEVSKEGKSTILHLYARKLGGSSFRLIGKWENIYYWNGVLNGVNGLEFSVDGKYCYFSKSDGKNLSGLNTIYFVNGPEGVVTCIVKNTRSLFRSSRDGNYLIFEDEEYNKASLGDKKFIIYNSIKSMIEAEVIWDIDSEDSIFYFRRDHENDKIRLALVSESFSVLAYAQIDTRTLSLKGKWIEKSDGISLQNFLGNEWRDDVTNLDKNSDFNIVGQTIHN